MKKDEKVEFNIFSDGRPITCPTLRGIRMGLYQCTKAGALCCRGCSLFSRRGDYYYCGYRERGNVFTRIKISWNFRVPLTVCDGCPHKK